MTRQELRVFLSGWFCGCGSPTLAAERLRDLLALHPLHSNREAFEAFVPDAGIAELLLYTLDHFELTEHGGTVGGAWLSDKGKAILEALNLEADTDFEKLTGTFCIHGHQFGGGPDDYEPCAQCNPA